jgi:hypothetical protein
MPLSFPSTWFKQTNFYHRIILLSSFAVVLYQSYLVSLCNDIIDITHINNRSYDIFNDYCINIVIKLHVKN